MSNDIAPELLERIQEVFDGKIKGNHTITAITHKIEKGERLDYREANKFAEAVGDALAAAFKRCVSPQELPDGKMYYNIADRVVRPLLVGNYSLIADVAEYTQNSLNKAAGINLAAQRPKINESRVQGLVDKVSSYDDYAEAAWVLDEPVVNFSQSVVDEFIKSNVEFQYNAGFQPLIERILDTGCCQWCANIAKNSPFKYPDDVPDDLYRRHDFCRCTVIFEPSKGKREGAHTKRDYANTHEAEIEERKANLERDAKKRKQKEEAKAKALKS